MSFLTVNNLSRKEKDQLIVDNANFEIKQFQKIAIAGATGSGKTSLLKMIAGLVQPSDGEIRFNNEKVIGPWDQLIPGHKGIAYLSQHFELFNNYWVHEILEIANQLSEEKAKKVYSICRIEHLMNRRTHELSGGEKQRIALARQLSTSPQLLLLDEPFSNLDAVHKSIIKSVIDDIGKQLGITCIMVSHDAQDILSWADSIFIMKDGVIIQHGTPEEVYHQPKDEYCAGLLGEYNLIGLNNKVAMIRPEQFVIGLPAANAVKATVQQFSFFGGHYIIHALMQGEDIKIKTDNRNLDIGQPIYISIKEGEIWYLPSV
jgi:ABC-type sugar transport system ATPase subunit